MTTGWESTGRLVQRTCSIGPTYRWPACVKPAPGLAYGEWIRRTATFGALVACLVLAFASVAAAAGSARPAVRLDPTTTEATIPGGNPELPRTALEADARDNGHTAQAPYIIWSGIAAVVVVAGGGLLFKRWYDRDQRGAGRSVS